MPSLSDLEIETILARVEAATPGPWDYSRADLGHPDNAINPMVITKAVHEAYYICRVGWQGSTVPGMSSLTVRTFEEAESNSDFLAHARTDVPRLCRELQATRVRIAQLEAAMRKTRDWLYAEGRQAIIASITLDNVGDQLDIALGEP